MEEIGISKFKAAVLAFPERVLKTRKPVRVTQLGKPVAEVVAPAVADRPASWIGSTRDTMKINGDIVGPVSDESDWEVFRS